MATEIRALTTLDTKYVEKVSDQLTKEGKRRESLALLFALAERLRETNQWPESYAIYRTLFHEYLDDQEYHRALYLASDMVADIWKRNKGNIDNRLLAEWCALIAEHRLMGDMGSKHWNYYLSIPRFQCNLFAMCAVLMLSKEKCSEEWTKSAATWWSDFVGTQLAGCGPDSDREEQEKPSQEKKRSDDDVEHMLSVAPGFDYTRRRILPTRQLLIRVRDFVERESDSSPQKKLVTYRYMSEWANEFTD